VLRVHTRCGSLCPSHLRSLWPVHFNELSFGRASGKSEEPRALSDVRTSGLGPHLRLIRFSSFLVFVAFFFVFVVASLLRTWRHHNYY